MQFRGRATGADGRRARTGGRGRAGADGRSLASEYSGGVMGFLCNKKKVMCMMYNISLFFGVLYFFTHVKNLVLTFGIFSFVIIV
jgi:hypothetical protein